MSCRRFALTRRVRRSIARNPEPAGPCQLGSFFRPLGFETLEDRRLLTGVDPTAAPLTLTESFGGAWQMAPGSDASAPDLALEFGAALDAGRSGGVGTSYEYVAPLSYEYQYPQQTNLPQTAAAIGLTTEVTAALPATRLLPQHISVLMHNGGGEIVFLGAAGSRNNVVFSVDAEGRLQHNLGGRFGFASQLDLDPTTDGVQSRRGDEITRLSYVDGDVAADDTVAISGGVWKLDRGTLAIRAGSISIATQVQARAITLDASGLIDLAAGAALVVQEGADGGRLDIATAVLVQTGEVHADGLSGGSVRVAADRVLSSAAISARGVGGAGGEVEIAVTENYVGTVGAGISADGWLAGGRVQIHGGRAGRLFSSGAVSVNGSDAAAPGGSIELLGREIVLVGAVADASGPASGGRILVGGGARGGDPAVPNARTVEASGASLRAAGRAGGTIVVWSDEATTFGGSLSTTGPGGGTIEVSSQGELVYAGTADAGRGGTLLLDPKNLSIDAADGVLPQFDLINPTPSAGDDFGRTVLPLSTGNVVVTDPGDDAVVTNGGAVYLYHGLSGALISVLTGSTPGDSVGNGYVVALNNGNYVVSTLCWDNGFAMNAGAVTWGSGWTGISGVVSSSNSLVGSTSGDQVGGYVRALSNGNYVVCSQSWDSGSTADVGAVTWGSGATGISGIVSSSNSLVGSTANDQVGSGGVIALNNGNYVVSSGLWDNGTATDAGAATWGSGTAGISGVVSSSNSLIGATSNDSVSDLVVALSNGNYVVRSQSWDDGSVTDAGAVTWGSGNVGIAGVVSSSNSLVGSASYDRVGEWGVVPLSNGNFVVVTPNWDNGAAVDAGAATWGSGTLGIHGAVSSSNSLVGSTTRDWVGRWGVVALSNGNYVVRSENWHNGSVANAGAATWGDGTIGINGVISSSNSLVGSSLSDGVGVIHALNNGNYVVRTPGWDNGSMPNVGAVTWGNGTTGISGVISSSNSLIGAISSDRVGTGTVTVLANGNYVAGHISWRNGLGAATWGNGTSGTSGVVSSSNSLVGSSSNDLVGAAVVALSNGNYVVVSSLWNNGSVVQAGAVTWGSGMGGVSGVVSGSNSLVGSASYDRVGENGVLALSNGHYVVSSSRWRNGSAYGAGAATWGDGTTGIRGPVSTNNSLVGSAGESWVGWGGVVALSSSDYVVSSRYWDSSAAMDAGAATWGNGRTGTTGVVSASNSVLGRTANAGLEFAVSDPFNNTFLTRFSGEGNGGRVTVAFGDPNQLSFARGQLATISVTPDRISDTLSLGTAVTQQASNDLAVNSPLVAGNPSGDAGSLTLQAGRSLLLGADITTGNGDLTLTANDTVANGVVDAQRDAGEAVIVMTAGTSLNVGTGTLSVALRNSSDKTNNARGVAILQDVTAAATVLTDGTVLANGTITGPITVASGAALGGIGTTGAVNVQSGGALAPGAAAGILRTGPVSFGSNSVFLVQIGGTGLTPVPHYDQLAVTGSVTLDASVTLSLSSLDGFVPAAGQVFTILDNDADDACAGTFAGLPEGAVISNFLGSAAVEARISYVGGDGNDVVLTTHEVRVVGRHVFYNDSYFDGYDAATGPQDDGAIAPDKHALLPGSTATFANYTSYPRGINGVMVDILGLEDPDALTPSSFQFRIGNSDAPAEWDPGPDPSSLTVRVGVGIGGSHRVTLIWPDGAIRGQWLQVIVRADAATKLAADDVFYFGSAVGESGNSPSDTYVDGTDFAGPRDSPRDSQDRAPIDFPYDYNRDSFVDGTDLAIARDHPTNFLTALQRITVPPAPASAAPGGWAELAFAEGEPPGLAAANSPSEPPRSAVRHGAVEAGGTARGWLVSRLSANPHQGSQSATNAAARQVISRSLNVSDAWSGSRLPPHELHTFTEPLWPQALLADLDAWELILNMIAVDVRDFYSMPSRPGNRE